MFFPHFSHHDLAGYVIITTRAAAPGRFAQRLLVETFPQEQGVLFLLRRAGLIALDTQASQASLQDRELAEADHTGSGLDSHLLWIR